jgi:hypothetical protein
LVSASATLSASLSSASTTLAANITQVEALALLGL